MAHKKIKKVNEPAPPSPLEELAESLVGKSVRLPNAAVVRVVGFGSKYFVWKRDGFTGSSELSELPACSVVDPPEVNK